MHTLICVGPPVGAANIVAGLAIHVKTINHNNPPDYPMHKSKKFMCAHLDDLTNGDLISRIKAASK